MARVLINEDFSFDLSDVQDVNLIEIVEWIQRTWSLVDVFDYWPDADEDKQLIDKIKEEY